MSEVSNIVDQQLLAPAELSLDNIQSVLSSALHASVDSADIYLQSSFSESWSLEDGVVKDAGYSADRGVGVRAISGEKVGFAFSDDIILPALQEAAVAARSIAKQGQERSVCALKKTTGLSLYCPDNPLQSLGEAEKVALLRRADELARKQDKRVKQVNASLSARYDVVLVAASDGTLSSDVRPLVRFNVSVIVEENGRIEQGAQGFGGRYDYNTLIKGNQVEGCVKKAVADALINLTAKPAPAGLMPVVLGPGWPGVLLHEAIGHGLEADFNRKGSSAFSGRIGERVASPLCTIVDDGTLNHLRGSLNVDDEGVPTECTTLIENGILKNYMQDKHNARLMKMKPTGNGRRESYAHVTLPRMTNTYMLAGSHDPQEIIASVEKGVYAVNFAGGQVDITNGKFVFSASEAYMIENGKLTYPIKGATLIGNGPDVLTKVSMVGNDLELDHGVGTCGKDGQSVPVSVGQPTLLIDELTVGGTQ
ncbi:MAG: metalloprotease TldD [Legionellaceae bacterium]|nr:metalloprotease TldD [Legionellaceae bacterium]